MTLLGHDPECPACGCCVHILTCDCGCPTSAIGAAYDHHYDVEEG